MEMIEHMAVEPAGFNRKSALRDAVFFLALAFGAGFALIRYSSYMDIYEQIILLSTVPATVWLTTYWRTLQPFLGAVAAAALIAIGVYAGDIKRADEALLLKYLLSSQSAVLWMCVLFVVATVSYWLGLLGRWATAAWVGSAMTWAAMGFGFVGLLVRWYESYLLGADVGHIPVSNLYEVFVMFVLITAGFYLYYENRYRTRALGGFVSLVITAAVGFLLWYTFDRQAHQIQPLVPALQSWWMKLHVPANFIGYGTFSLAAMVAFAYLIKAHGETQSWWKLAPLWVFGVLLCAEPFVFRRSGIPDYWAIYFGTASVIVGGIIAARRRIAESLPTFDTLDDLMYKSIAIGFAFFTIATILGALWAADAWGTYWQWDPKETWALIVWLNYAAWLHLRLMKGLRGTFSAYWALIGLLITGFAFLGVNMFLSGLHSYGEL